MNSKRAVVRLRRLVVASIGTLLILVGAEALANPLGRASSDRGSGSIIYTTDRGIFSMQSDGSGVHRIQRFPYPEAVDISEDGGALTFDGPSSIYFKRLGHKPRRIDTGNPDAGGRSRAPHFSPSGRRILYQGFRGITVSNLRGGNRKLVPFTASAIYPSFNPKRPNTIVYEKATNFGERIWTSHLDGSNRRLLTPGRGIQASYPSYSPDGRSIVYIDWSSRNRTRLMVMDSDGSNKREVGKNVGGYLPRFSPDGSRIAIIGSRRRQGIFVIGTDGSGLKRISKIRPSGIDWGRLGGAR